MDDALEALQAEQAESERARKVNESLGAEVDKLKSELNDAERQLIIARKHADELDAQLKSSQARQATLENELSAARKEMETTLELNMQLQRERQEIQKWEGKGRGGTWYTV